MPMMTGLSTLDVLKTGSERLELEIFPRKELVPMVYGKTRTNSATGGRSASSSFCKSHRGMKDAGRSLRSSVVLPEFSSFLMKKVL